MSTERLIMLVLSLPVMIYVIKIGGDARHFRYLAFPFVLSVLATGGLIERISSSSRLPRVLIFVAIALATISNYPRQLQQHPLFLSSNFTHNTFLLINDAAAHRLHRTGITPSGRSFDSVLSYKAAKERYAQETALEEIASLSPDYPLAYAKPERSNQSESRVPVIVDHWCQTSYLHAALPSIHTLGLTDAFLARTQMPSDRPAHKLGLFTLAKDLLRIRAKYGFRRGAFDDAISADPSTPAWVTGNIHTLRSIEQRVYNRHRLIENITYALQRIRKIQPQLSPNQ
jgi:hypothetical protein